MHEIDPIYKNHFGLGFYWRKEDVVVRHAVQIVFRDIGFYLTKKEIVYFSKLVTEAKRRSECSLSCQLDCCRSVLLKTPSQLVDLALNRKELEAVNDLLEGILFHIELREYIHKLSLN